MNEYLPSEYPPSERADARSKVVAVMAEKAWYGLASDGSFDMAASVNKIAMGLGLPDDLVMTAMEGSFDESCLASFATKDEEGKEKQVYLVEALSMLRAQVYLWTVGDTNWQQTKIDRSGAARFIPKDRILNYGKDKIIELRSLLSSKAKEIKDAQKNLMVIVVDDKQKNIDEVYAMQDDFSQDGIQLRNYHLKLSDLAANPASCYAYINGLINDNPDCEVLVLLDFDGVVANTDGVIYGKASDKLAELVLEKKA